MTAVVRADTVRIPGSRTLRYQGRDHGSGVSFFLVTNDPGQGPGLHRHPYSETWHVVDGEATLTIDDQTVVARRGDTAVVGPDVWHGFINSGTGILRMICIHASDTMIQENL